MIRSVVAICCALLFAASLHGQTTLPLDSSCTVTVANQTAFVGAGGKFLLRNIATFINPAVGTVPELYRVRATCLRDGQMATGQSAFFALTPGQTSFVGDVHPTALDPIPIRLQLTTSTLFLPQGETAQLSTLGVYDDGSSRDLTPRSAGTTYLASNPDLLTVSDDGLVTGRNGGPSNQLGMVSALNEGNTVTIFITAVADSNDFDGDGLPNDYEDLFGFNKFSFDSFLDPDNDGLSNFDEFQKGTLPNNPDTDLDGILDGEDEDPLRPEMDPPTVRLISPAAGATLFQSATVEVEADAHDDGRVASVEILANGASLGTATARPFEVVITIPFATGQLTFTARATDSAGHSAVSAPVQVSVTPDPGTAVQGVVEDVDATPVAGAAVSLTLRGIRGELFDFTAPLTSIPDLSGLTPDASKLASALYFRNPGGALSPDTFGVGFSPDFAARFQGFARVAVAGQYDVTLGADDGARLLIDGSPVVETSPFGVFQPVTQRVTLRAGLLPLEVDYFQSVGASELTLDISPVTGGPAGDRVVARSVSPTGEEVELFLDSGLFTTTTGADGSFSFAGVPAALGRIAARVATTIGGLPRTGAANEIDPVPGGITDFGTITLDPGPACVTGTLLYRNCLSGPVTVPIELIEDDGGGPTLRVGVPVSPASTPVTPDPTGRFCVLLRRDRFYFLRQATATCGAQTASCSAFLALTDPNATGACGDPGANCQELGDVDFFCGFFGGS